MKRWVAEGLSQTKREQGSKQSNDFLFFDEFDLPLRKVVAKMAYNAGTICLLDCQDKGEQILFLCCQCSTSHLWVLQVSLHLIHKLGKNHFRSTRFWLRKQIFEFFYLFEASSRRASMSSSEVVFLFLSAPRWLFLPSWSKTSSFFLSCFSTIEA